VRLKEVAGVELLQLSKILVKKWGHYSGRLPDADKLAEINRLTERYARAREAYDDGRFLTCIELSACDEP
jgi:hypothetical protein